MSTAEPLKGATFGRLLPRNASPAPMSDINMTPLIDVMLVLLVIFILTAPLLAAAIRLELPRNQAAAPTPHVVNAVHIALDKSGQLYFNQHAVSLSQLREQLQAAAQSNAQTEVQLRADEAVPYGQVVLVMGAAQQAGLSRIGFVAKP